MAGNSFTCLIKKDFYVAGNSFTCQVKGWSPSVTLLQFFTLFMSGWPCGVMCIWYCPARSQGLWVQIPFELCMYLRYSVLCCSVIDRSPITEFLPDCLKDSWLQKLILNLDRPEKLLGLIPDSEIAIFFFVFVFLYVRRLRLRKQFLYFLFRNIRMF